MPVVLNVDDNDAVRYCRSYLLRHAGYDVVEACSGFGTLSAVKECHPAAVLLDVHLPDIDGLTVCRRIKDDPATSLVRVISISGTAMFEPVEEAALAAGADYYLTDPVADEVLLSTVAAACRNSKSDR